MRTPDPFLPAPVDPIGFAYVADERLSPLFDATCPVYEHNSFYQLFYVSAHRGFYFIEQSGNVLPLVLSADSAFFCTPRITNWPDFLALCRQLSPTRQIMIRYLSKNQLTEMGPHAADFFHPITHSGNEVFYRTELLVNLKGQDFSSLRQTRNRLLKAHALHFEPLDASNLPYAIAVLTDWTNLRGHLYPQKRLEREINLILAIATHPAAKHDCVIAYHNNRPVGLGLLSPSVNREVGILHLVKGINQPAHGGTHGVSDSIYLHLAEIAAERGYTELNDGDLGQEAGTIQHKLSLKPIRTTQTYNLTYRRIGQS